MKSVNFVISACIWNSISTEFWCNVLQGNTRVTCYIIFDIILQRIVILQYKSNYLRSLFILNYYVSLLTIFIWTIKNWLVFLFFILLCIIFNFWTWKITKQIAFMTDSKLSGMALLKSIRLIWKQMLNCLNDDQFNLVCACLNQRNSQIKLNNTFFQACIWRIVPRNYIY